MLVLVDVGQTVENSEFPGQSWEMIWFHPGELTICLPDENLILPTRAIQPTAAPTGHRANGIFQEGQPPPDMVGKIVRYTSVWKALGLSGGNFSTKNAGKQRSEAEQKVWKAQQDEIFATMSQPLPENKWFDYFISYRWKTGRLFTTLSLMVHLNHWKAAVVTFGSTLVIQVTAALVDHYYGVAILPNHLLVVTAFSEISRPGTFQHPWFFSIWFRSVMMSLGVFCFSQLASRSRVFIDKLCISQGDSELNVSSLRHFPYLLKRCRKLICVVDATYFDRLWCTFQEF